MEELLSAIETGSVDKVKEVIDNTAVSPTACSEVSLLYVNNSKYVHACVCMFPFSLIMLLIIKYIEIRTLIYWNTFNNKQKNYKGPNFIHQKFNFLKLLMICFKTYSIKSIPLLMC